METGIIRLLFDTGLCVLIWMIQLVVYPSFLYYNNENLVSWHKKYTAGLSLVVIPLMFGQLGITVYQLKQLPVLENGIHLALVLAVWIITFIQFVPIHGKIAKGNSTPTLLKKLVCSNWWRTALWTLTFFWSLYSTM